MNLVSQSQWSGWFAGWGSGGQIFQNVITTITPILMACFAIYFVFLIMRTAPALSSGTPEGRKEAKIRVGWLVVAIILTISGPTLILIFMNTIGKTVQTTSPSGGTQASLYIEAIKTAIPQAIGI